MYVALRTAWFNLLTAWNTVIVVAVKLLLLTSQNPTTRLYVFLSLSLSP